MTSLFKFAEFLKDNGKFVLDNLYIFAIWTLLVITITSLFFTFYNKKLKEKYDEALKIIEAQKVEIKQQKEHYEKIETEVWMHPVIDFSNSPAAENMSKAIQETYK